MPHVNSGGGDDLASSDEVKIYKDEGDEEQRQSENLSEDKLGLVSESEEVRHNIPHMITALGCLFACLLACLPACLPACLRVCYVSSRAQGLLACTSASGAKHCASGVWPLIRVAQCVCLCGTSNAPRLRLRVNVVYGRAATFFYTYAHFLSVYVC